MVESDGAIVISPSRLYWICCVLAIPAELFIALDVMSVVTGGSFERLSAGTYVISGLLAWPSAVIALVFWLMALARAGAAYASAWVFVLTAWLGVALTLARYFWAFHPPQGDGVRLGVDVPELIVVLVVALLPVAWRRLRRRA